MSLKMAEEREKGKGQFFPNLLTLTAEQRLKATELIERYGGRVRIIVHPYFDELSGNVKFARYTEVLTRLFGSESKQSIPMIIFEEGGYKYRQTQGRVETMIPEANKEKIFFIPTFDCSPIPDISYSGTLKCWQKTEADRCAVWNKLMQAMSGLGIKQVLVGGQQLKVYKGNYDWDGGYLKAQFESRGNDCLNGFCLGNCVGTTAIRLAEKFEVEISNIAFPERRSTVLWDK